MALAKEFMGCSIMERKSSFTTSKVFPSHNSLQSSNTKFLVPGNRERIRLSKTVRGPMAAIISGDLIKKAAAASVPVEIEKPTKFKVTTVVTVRNMHESLKDAFAKHLDKLNEFMGMNVVLQLVSTEADPKTKAPRKSRESALKDWTKKSNAKAERVNYTAEFELESNFGTPGAILVTNKHQKEFFVESITVEGFASGPVHFPCNSWVQPKKNNPAGKRIFFSNMPYLPCETPEGLKALREKELKDLRGDGKGVRKLSDRIYDYDVYNDLGNPDKGIEYARPVLGGEKISYPRRCRTGRVSSHADVNAESRVEKPRPMYVPRDEQFEEIKKDTFKFGRQKAQVHNAVPLLSSILTEKNDFSEFSEIDKLYTKGVLLKPGFQEEILKKLPLPKAVCEIQGSSQAFFKYDIPLILSKDRFAWLRDDEFARQAIAGVNPVNIERLEVFPPKSNLDPQFYGPQKSALLEEHILGNLNGMSVQEALEQNRLFMLDYHDLYLPFIERINALDGRKSYATRTIFFLTDVGTLKPIAIELSLPWSESNSESKQVVTPPVDATTTWTWQLAKAHVCSNDAGAHQLVNHWLRTHACIEPFILAAHRQLSAMHPIFKLLDPHMRYTLEINALARQNLINANGVIENTFTPGRYCMDISAAAYKNWRFDMEGLPADLIRRGMAVPDPTQPHGLKLLIEDYPYASDGLPIWFAIESWVRSYVNHYYPNSSLVCNDKELQAWYAESINVGHADLRQENWWPELNNAENLVYILTTIIWLASAQHAALNFGQYPYGGYVPNRPPLMRKLVPNENDQEEYTSFLSNPQKYFMSAIPSLVQSITFMAVVDNLSTHSPDEEYIGERQHPSVWTGDAEIIEAFYRFSAEIRQIEKEIDQKNSNRKLRNRCGAGVLPYELLAPSSGPGVTCRGIPNSVSI